jgi:hypothetical protein
MAFTAVAQTAVVVMRHFFGRFDSNGARREGGPDALLAPAYDILTMSVMPELKLGPTYLRTQLRTQRTPMPANSWTRVLERVPARPGVRASSLSVLTPLSGRDTD